MIPNSFKGLSLPVLLDLLVAAQEDLDEAIKSNVSEAINEKSRLTEDIREEILRLQKLAEIAAMRPGPKMN